MAAAAAAVAVVAAAWGVASCGTGSSGQATGRTDIVLSSSLAPWHLPVALSGEAVAADGGGVLVAGGLTATDASLDGVLRVDPATGTVHPAGTLPAATHDAAAATTDAGPLLFGGGSSTSTATVAALPGRPARVVGRLPQVRSDLAAASIGPRAILLGGYDGTRLLGQVLATRDGRSFSVLGRLPVPVRYPAVAALGDTVYAVGGQAADGRATAVVQTVDAATGRSRVLGRLPVATAHAAAVALHGDLYVLGGQADGAATDRVWRVDPRTGAAHPAGSLPLPVADAAGVAVGGVGYLVGGVDAAGRPLNTTVVLRERKIRERPPPAARAGGSAASVPFDGRLMIADRGNNRLLLVDAAKHVLWRYPAPGRPAPPGGFYFPDDAFFFGHGSGVISNEEDNNAIVELGFPSGRLLWSYGHAKVAGSGRGYLNQPDDAYLLANGTVAVADAKNCRILIVAHDGRTLHQIGTTGSCVHDPPRRLGYPNGDTPLPDGNVLISEIFGSYIDEITPAGRLLWTVKLPLTYPSDPQQLGPDRYLVADYAHPGGVYQFDREGHILWAYHPRHGPGMLDHPSLAERLPNGLIAVNDDYRDRVVLIDPATRRIVWQYGHTDHRGTGPDHLAIPDGFDLLAAGGRTPTHPQTG